MKGIIIHIVLSLFLCQFALADGNFDKGVEAFSKEDYALASEHFKKVTEETPMNISAYYNLGLSYIGNEEYGLALWAFEKVLKFNPSDAAAAERASLAFNELSSEEEWTPILNGPFSFVHHMSSNTWSIISIVLSILFAIVVVLFRTASTLSLKRITLIASLTSFILLFVSVIISHNVHSYKLDHDYAIVTKKSIPTYINENVASGELFAGERVHKTAQFNESMIKVQDNEGNEYIVRDDDLSFL